MSTNFSGVVTSDSSKLNKYINGLILLDQSGVLSNVYKNTSHNSSISSLCELIEHIESDITLYGIFTAQENVEYFNKAIAKANPFR